VGKPERFGCDDIERRRWLALAGQDVEHDVAADRGAGQRLDAGGLDRVDPVGHHRGEDPYHLPVAIAVMPLDVTPSFPPAGIRAGPLCCAWARLKQWAV